MLVKFSPYREKMLDSFIKNVEGIEENETVGNKEETLDVQRAGRLEQGIFKRSSLIIAACNGCEKNVPQKL